MLAEEIDFYKIFKLHPTAMALLTTDLEFVDANDEFLAATGHSLDEVIGRNAFAVLPKMPSDPGREPKWTALEEAQASGRREGLTLTRYDIEDPARPGVFREQYWSSSVTPVRGRDGRVEVLEFSAREVTSIITEFKELQEEERQTTKPRSRVATPEKKGQVGTARPRVPAPESQGQVGRARPRVPGPRQEGQTRKARPRVPGPRQEGQTRKARPRVQAPAPPADNNPVPVS